MSLAPGAPIGDGGGLMPMQQHPPTGLPGAIQFQFSKRPNHGVEGRAIVLRANHFKVSIPGGTIQYYQVDIQPDKCPRKVNHEFVNTIVDSFNKILMNIRPVYDGKRIMYTREPNPGIGRDKVDVEVLMPGDSSMDRKFKVSIKWVPAVSLSNLEDAMLSRIRQVPLEAIQAMDVILRHLPSMRYTPVGRSFFQPPASLMGQHDAPVHSGGAHYHTGDSKLGDGREVWFGFHQSVRPSQWKMMLNIDEFAKNLMHASRIIVDPHTNFQNYTVPELEKLFREKCKSCLDSNGTISQSELDTSASEIEAFCRLKWGGKFVVIIGQENGVAFPMGSAITAGSSENTVDFKIKRNFRALSILKSFISMVKKLVENKDHRLRKTPQRKKLAVRSAISIFRPFLN